MSGNALVTRLAVDIGGTFTDIVLERPDGRTTAKVLTTPRAPEQAVIDGIGRVLQEAGLRPSDVGLLLHGTTLATNAVIQRRGAVTALLTTEGFRDTVEIADESRFDQYDLNIDKPAPLTPRRYRLTVPERVDVDGRVVTPLDEDAVAALLPELDRLGVQSLAIGFLHSYVNPDHERRAGEILKALRPDLYITLSSDVCPEIREYERLTTASVNAYVQPLMASYLDRLEAEIGRLGMDCPLLLMSSGGGLVTVETAKLQPVRLIESGPAGGAILAAVIAQEGGWQRVLSFDMGGTTAKICLIDDYTPQTARTFEVDRAARFLKGSGLRIRIPVIEMVEIGAGGGSIAHLDETRRIAVGPDSAGSEPGPVCYGRGGTEPAVTDADVVLGRIDPDDFAGGRIRLDASGAEQALARVIGEPLRMDGLTAAFGVAEMVDETMASAARVHAVEHGKDLGDRTLIAFGGAAPLHACRLAAKLGIGRIVIPAGAGVGSAVGFLRAPVAYEVVRSRYMRLAHLDLETVNGLFADMVAEAEAVVRAGAPDASLAQSRSAAMRYVGQGHEITVELPPRALAQDDLPAVAQGFEEAYRRLYGRTIPGLDIEVLNYALALTAPLPAPVPSAVPEPRPAPEPVGRRRLFDPVTTGVIEAPVYRRGDLVPGSALEGPAVIVETDTSIVVLAPFDARVDAMGAVVLESARP
ncbi:hydantoinase/oxoprolinase family protein [Marinivivus vitaminiproducens]|uniref:hydantoinase/oxoprolinase family protein n=1 Tax=Marinivivus vitaminiproducens TaxID=3035935 RepID=UPI00279AEEA1|nr:hydantoinase/oxoprolinase family protein [Geminicoccaceae bacterium SCSIO 64248]